MPLEHRVWNGAGVRLMNIFLAGLDNVVVYGDLLFFSKKWYHKWYHLGHLEAVLEMLRRAGLCSPFLSHYLSEGKKAKSTNKECIGTSDESWEEESPFTVFAINFMPNATTRLSFPFGLRLTLPDVRAVISALS